MSLFNRPPARVACSNYEVVVLQPYTGSAPGLDSVAIIKPYYLVSPTHLLQPCSRYFIFPAHTFYCPPICHWLTLLHFSILYALILLYSPGRRATFHLDFALIPQPTPPISTLPSLAIMDLLPRFLSAPVFPRRIPVSAVSLVCSSPLFRP